MSGIPRSDDHNSAKEQHGHVRYAPAADAKTSINGVLTGAIIVQIGAACIALFVPFGFDKPSSWGLDFESFLKLLVLYATAMLCGCTLSIVARRWGALLLQLLIPFVTLFGMVVVG